MISDPSVYLLLRTHNRPEEFKHCIKSISEQSVIPKIIIISDDNKDYYIHRRAEKYTKRLKGSETQEAKTLLDNAQKKLDTAENVKNEILDQVKRDGDRLIIELNDKFHKSSELKKSLAENKINQMKETAIKEIKDASIKIAVDSVKKIITTSVDKSKLDAVFQKNLNETKEELKKN